MNVWGGVVAAALILGLGHGGLTQALGAHPFWAGKVTLIGAPLGVLLFWAGQAMGARWITAACALLALVSYAVAFQGKARFAASYAEDRFAGQLWFFGWIATAAFATVVVAWVISALLHRFRQSSG